MNFRFDFFSKNILFQIIVLITLTLPFNLFGQKRSIEIRKAIGEIELDGLLNEKSWEIANEANDFYSQFPVDTGYAKTKTSVKLTFDEQFLYIGAICYDQNPEKDFVVTSLQRDFSYRISDAFAVYIDPFYDKTNGFSFSVNPYGVQREGLIESSGTFGVSNAWDNKWFVEVKHFEGYWAVEMKIPFKTIRYKSELNKWGINFSRNNLKINENSAWSRVPINFNVAVLNYTGDLIWNSPPPKPGLNMSLIPYSTGGYHSDYETSENRLEGDLGIDAKIAISSSLNLDLTVNPDFSNVDVDQQVTNLSRFSLFFPERRQFFIENSDLFGRFGFRRIRPFFSRRIGLYNGEKVPIIAGARLSGKVNENWRIGLMNMQTEGNSSLDLEAQNYTVGAFQRQVGSSSNIAGIFVNRQGFSNDKIDYFSFNRIVGLDYNLASEDSKYRGKLFYHHSFTPSSNDYSHSSWFMYNTRNIRMHWNHEYVGKDYRAETGFVPRIQYYNSETKEYIYRSYWRFEPSFEYSFYPDSKKINRHSFLLKYDEYFNDDFTTNERKIRAAYFMRFVNKAFFNLELKQNKIYLPFNTDITFSGITPLDSGYYYFRTASLKLNSSPFSEFNYEFFADYGEYYTGNKLTYGGNLSYRLQPYGNISIDFEQNYIWMPANELVRLTLVSPRFDLTLTKKMFFTTFIQYNTQIENININARFQYRFKPMSDLFIVYTDNYNSNIFGIKNRAIVLKLVYWLSV